MEIRDWRGEEGRGGLMAIEHAKKRDLYW